MTLIVDLLVTVTPDINLVLTRAQLLVLDTMINPTLIIILHTTIVIGLDMTNIITDLLLNHIILLHVHTIILPLLVVHPNFILVLVSAPLVIITPLLNDITLLTVLLVNHVMIATVDCTETQKTTIIFNINPLLILLNHLHHFCIRILLQNPNLKLISITLILLHHNIPHFLMNMLMHYTFNLVCQFIYFQTD